MTHAQVIDIPNGNAVNAALFAILLIGKLKNEYTDMRLEAPDPNGEVCFRRARSRIKNPQP